MRDDIGHVLTEIIIRQKHPRDDRQRRTYDPATRLKQHDHGDAGHGDIKARVVSGALRQRVKLHKRIERGQRAQNTKRDVVKRQARVGFFMNFKRIEQKQQTDSKRKVRRARHRRIHRKIRDIKLKNRPRKADDAREIKVKARVYLARLYLDELLLFLRRFSIYLRIV